MMLNQLKLLTQPLVTVLVVMLLALVAGMPQPALAATANYATTIPGVQVIPIHISGQYDTTADDAVQLKLPFAATVIGVSATARASGGTNPTLAVDVLEDDTSILDSAIDITAGTVSEGTVTDASVADEAELTVDLTIGGGTPTWDDITVLITVIRQ